MVCKNSKIYPYLDLGLQPRANSFLKIIKIAMKNFIV